MIFFSLVIAMYFLPTIVAANRGHHITGVLLLNLLFGWTIIGWFALLLWALLSAPRYCVVVTAPPNYYYPYANYRR